MKRSTDKKETPTTLDKEILDLWSQCIIIKDGCCRITHTQDSLTAHHIRSRGHAATRYDLENGMCLSWKWHFLQKANPERFFDSIIDIIGMDEYLRLKAKSQRICKRNMADLREERDRLRKQLAYLRADYGWDEKDDKLLEETGL